MENIPTSPKRLAGKRYINLVRCSSDMQTETSIPDQLKLLNAFAAKNGMVHAGNDGDDHQLANISGSKPGNREELQKIIDRKISKNDFDVLLVQSEDRLTRSGTKHAFWYEYELISHGIEIVYAASDVPDCPFSDFLQMMKFQAAQETAKSTSLNSTRGYQRALEERNVATSTHTPYGCYRLYCSADGKQLLIIRDNRDGTQDELDPQTRNFIRGYGVVGGKAKGHFKKQKSDKVYLVPGNPLEIDVVRLIFQRKYLEGIGGRRIAAELNRQMIAAPMGKQWTQRQVDCIAENEVYTGVGVANRFSSGRYYQRAKGQPESVSVNPTVLAKKKVLPVRMRPPEEWVYQEQPHLKNFLPEPLRSIAAERIRQVWMDRCQPGREKRPYNPHPDSDYLLSGLLTAAEDGRKLKGYTSGPIGRHVRYYVHPLAQKDPVRAGFPNKLIRADVLETAVLAAITETMLAMPNLKDEVDAAVRMATVPQPSNADEIAKLREQKAALSKKIAFVMDLTDAAPEEAKAKIFFLKNEQRQIDEQLRLADEAVKVPPQDPVALSASIIDRMKELGTTIGGMPTYQLRQVLASLIATATISMVSGEVQIELRIPPTAIIDAKTAIGELSLRQTSGSSTLSQAQKGHFFVIAMIDCRFSRQEQKPCFVCRRRAA
jgi:DNA invertase Pin-like site-specific DNA recombinase